ncbi:MAG: hypothetical protein JWP27_2838 [Flaviaesturariibacter sp.]|nr:hypothetical protein [Flaviaesturariibacter sp.]
MRYLLLLSLFFTAQCLRAQSDSLGILTGTVLDEKKKALEGASVTLLSLPDSSFRLNALSDQTGSFDLSGIPHGVYRLRISFVGFQPVSIDSIHFRPDRADFNLSEIILKAKGTTNLDEVIVYAEKPLIQSKDGNITFNAAESALSAGSSANELLTNVPLVTKDPSGKLLVRGKEPKILIDDKPVELNQQQLQDLLESLPGSAIEKIEVMTNPPPQYANEQGGVINITTRKGRVGKSGRLNISGGTRGEASINGSFTYRKNAFSMNLSGGLGYNDFKSEGYSLRTNYNTDSTARTNNSSNNRALRPNFRGAFDYDIDKSQSLNLVLQYNRNRFDNVSANEFQNLNQFDRIYRLSQREVQSDGGNSNAGVNLNYTLKRTRPGESLKIFTSYNYSVSNSDRDFYQRYLNPDYSDTGRDTTTNQVNDNTTNSYHVRVNYDLPFANKKTFVSAGGYESVSRSDVQTVGTYLNKTSSEWKPLQSLTNGFVFHQSIANLRGSVRQMLAKDFSATAGLSAEYTSISFDLDKGGASNGYWTVLPFANINRNWRDVLNLTVSYRKSIRRPGSNELNPTVDVADPRNIRSGNPGLMPSLTHNFDLVLGRTTPKYYANIGFGYNIVENIFSQLRTSLAEDTILIRWENISGRHEYEVSTWNGYTVSKKAKINLSASYTFNCYSDYDKTVHLYRNGGSLTSNLNGNYNITDLWTATGSFTFNHFANPQGSVRSNVSMNVGVQAKLFKKRGTVTLNFIDPFRQQQNRNTTFGKNYMLENYNLTQTRNIRLSLAYNFTKTAKKPLPKKPGAKSSVPKAAPKPTQ